MGSCKTLCNRLWTSATVTLYFDVELSNDNLPGTEQKISPGDVTPDMTNSFPFSFFGRIPANITKKNT
jgi:hypothetical protein